MSDFFNASDGARLAFSETGAGLHVIFLHPTPLDGGFWPPLTAQLPGIRAIIPDLRGHGRSQTGSNLPLVSFNRISETPALTMSRYAADVLALLDFLHLSKAVFVGSSIGGYVLLELWRQAPQRICGLAFLCSKPQPDSDANLPKRAATIEQIHAGQIASVYDGMAHTLIGTTARRLHPAIVNKLRSSMTPPPETLIAVQAGLATRPDSIPTLASINVPVLAIAGAEDPAATPGEMESFRAIPGGCDFHLIPDAGHFAAYEQPSTVAALLAPWLLRFH